MIATDLKLAARGLKRNPAFSLAAIAVLAIGIGSSAAVFSVVDRLLFRDLPYSNSQQLVSIGIRHPILDFDFLIANDYLRLREEQTPFAALASWTGVADCDLTEDQNPLRLACAQVDSHFLETFAITPIAGRTFTADEDSPSARKVALISHAIWQQRFASERNIIGKTIPIDGTPTEIIGVLPRDFELPTLQKVDFLVPQALNIRHYTPGETGRPLRVFGRLKPGVSIEQARTAIAPITAEFLRFIPAHMRSHASIELQSLRDFQIHDVRLASWVLFATTLAILLIVCANVANLILARSEARRNEFAMRLALGASRWRLVRQSLVESLFLSGTGGVLAIGLALVLIQAFRALAPVTLPRIEQATLDLRVAVFLVLAALASGIIVGFAPAFSSIRLEALTGWRATTPERHLVRRALIAAQIALSLTLLSDATLLSESLRRMTSMDGGLTGAERITAGEMTLGTARHPNSAARQQFFDTLVERLKSNPLVTSVALSDTVPPSGFIHNRPLAGLSVIGRPDPDQPSGTMVSNRRVSPEYFSTLRIPILRGRTFTEAERSANTDSIVISAALAKTLFGSADNPIGQVIHFKPNGPDAIIIGVAANADNAGIPGRSDPEYYLLRKKVTDPAIGMNASLVTRNLHTYDGQAFIIVKSAADPKAVANWIHAEVAALDPTCAVTVTTLADRVRDVSARARFNATLLSLFALVGLIVSAAGLYGLIAFLVAQRTQEIGIRLALGATAPHIATMVLGSALRSTALGIALGLIGAISTERLLRGILFGIGNLAQSGLIAAAAVTLFAVVVGAAVAPASRAARIDPAIALRND